MTKDQKFSSAPSGRGGPRAASDPIALGLRRLWSEVEKEAVPDDFLDLLDQIDERRSHEATSPDSEPAGSKDGCASL